MNNIKMAPNVTPNEKEFNSLDFEKRLMQLKDSQDSINQLSAWCLKNRQYHKKIVASWLNALKKVRVEQRLVLFYLANDVIQFSKRKNYEFVESWSTALQKATTFVRDEKVKPKILRIFKIWENRCVYSDEILSDLSGLISASPNKKSEDHDVNDFQSSYLISKIKNCIQLGTETEMKLNKLKEFLPKIKNLDVICANLKDRKNVSNVEKEVDGGITMIEAYVETLKIEIKTRAHLLTVLEQAEAFYHHERGEVKVVANAYKNFGSRVKNLKKKLDELLPSLGSPIPSPDINAPSPSPDSDFELPELSFSDYCNNTSNQDFNSFPTTNTNFNYTNNSIAVNNDTTPIHPDNYRNSSNPSGLVTVPTNAQSLLASIPSIPFFESQSLNTVPPIIYNQMPLASAAAGNNFVFDQNVINHLAASVFNYNANQHLSTTDNSQDSKPIENRNLINLTASPTDSMKNLIEEGTDSIFERIKTQTALKPLTGINNWDEKSNNLRTKNRQRSRSSSWDNDDEPKSKRISLSSDRRHIDRSRGRSRDRSLGRLGGRFSDGSHVKSRERDRDRSRSRSRKRSPCESPILNTEDRVSRDKHRYHARDRREQLKSSHKH